MVSEQKKEVIGLTEKIDLFGPESSKTLIARIDTGATLSSIDKSLAKELNLGPVIKKKVIISAHGRRERPVIKAVVRIGRKKIKARFSIADRKHMRYKVLVGQNILKKRFIINPDKKR